MVRNLLCPLFWHGGWENSLDNTFSRVAVLMAVFMKIEIFGILNRLAKVTDFAGPPVTSNLHVQQSEMEVAPPPPETWLTIYQLTQRNIPEDFFMRLLKARVVLLNLVAEKLSGWGLCHNQYRQMMFT
jgi:hypothetical protein